MIYKYLLEFLLYIILLITLQCYVIHENDKLILKQVILDDKNISFYVGSNHYEWCLYNEAQQTLLTIDILKKKENNCVLIDVGMNDGFYTNLAGVLGCQVWSFELQRKCIDLAKYAITTNKIDDLVTIMHLPVSSKHGKLLNIPFPEEQLCDGGFSFSGNNTENRLTPRSKHKHNNNTDTKPLFHIKTFQSITLDSFIHRNTYIDILKIDTEGHETEVLIGSLNLFRQHRIGIAFVELGAITNYNNFTDVINIYRQITSYNYSITTLNCNSKRGNDDTFNINNFDSFISYAYLPWNAKYRCPDLKIHM